MTELGMFLKGKREERNLTLEELQTATKIQKRYLAAIEEGNYSILPGPFYARAFIKNYCEAVGLDYEAVFAEYEKDIPKAAREPEEFTPRSERPRTVGADKESAVRKYVPMLVIAGVVLIVIMGVYMLIQNLGGDQVEEKKKSESLIETDKDVKKGDKQKEEKTKEETAPKEPEPEKPDMSLVKKETEGNMTAYELSGTDVLDIGFALSGPSYVDIKDASGKFLLTKQFKNGETYTFKAEGQKEILLNIGAAHTTKLTLNGVPFTYPVAPLEKVHQKILIRFVQ
ncbi:helix-turn-helix domain-containing protein [Fictibacillus iocasae]|uniref:Helix-turn-helix domain-containing protein n=1 Tax=Fictibacillus iocasae TaxID=2715437 RepID=A0ABW2NSD9_9BACL